MPEKSKPIFRGLHLPAVLLVIITHFYGAPVMAGAPPQELQGAWQALTGKDYDEKAQALEQIANTASPQAFTALNALLDSRLYYSKTTQQPYLLSETEAGYRFEPLYGGETLEQARKRGFKKVKINNHIRGLIRQLLANAQLSHEDAGVRLAAVQELLKNPDAEGAKLIEPLIADEPDVRVAELMQVLLAVEQLKTEDAATQSQAITVLRESLSPAAFNALQQFDTDDDTLTKQALAAVKHIEHRREYYAMAETVFFGLSLGSVLALAAIGLAITFGVMGVINMAHGELIMLGAYTTYVTQLLMPNHIGTSILIAIPAAFMVSGLAGIAIERGVIRHLYGRPLETLLATFGISLILQQGVRSIFSPLNRTVETPAWMSGAWQVNEVLALTWNRLYIIVFSLAVFALFIALMKYTRLGLQVRAVSQNRAMARAMGVRSEWVDALTFGLGSGIAGIAGVALSLLTNVGPNLGQAYIVDSFMVVVFGGVGNMWGTLVAGMSLGVINKTLEPWTGAVLGKILVLVFIILFIQKRPKGLFPQRGRAAE